MQISLKSLTTCSSRQGITIGTWKRKAFQADLGIFTDTQTYSGIFRNYSGIFNTLCKLGIFRTLAYWEPEPYSELWYIQETSILRTRGISRTKGIFRTAVYSNTWDIENQRHTQNLVIFRTLACWEPQIYSQPCQTSTMESFTKIVKSYYFCKSLFLQYQLFTFSTLWNTYHEFF